MRCSFLGSGIDSCTPILIQQHTIASSVSFNRTWDEYKHGFGDTGGNYWIGNNVLTWLTAMGKYKLKFDLQSRNTSKWYYAKYSTFRVLSEAHNYKLQVDGFSGNVSHDALGDHNNGQQFSTVDRDNDQSSGNCAASSFGGFWWGHCGACCVNAARSTGLFRWVGLPGGDALQLSRMWLECK